MLSERTREILTAYFDGELSQRHRKAVVQLLQRSAEARAYLLELKETAQLLRQLPKKTLPADFSRTVLQALANRDTLPVPAVRPPQRSSWWVRLAVAAVVLLAMGIAGQTTYRWFADPDDGRLQASGPSLPAPEVTQPQSVRLDLAELKQKDAHDQLTRDLKKQPSFHLDLSVSNSTQAVRRVQDAFQHQGIKVVEDGQAQIKLKENQPKTSYLVYTENVRPEEVAGILQKLGDDQEKTLRVAMLSPMSSGQRGELARAFGVAENQLAPAPPIEMELRLPVQAPPGKGNSSKAPPGVKVPEVERVAVVIAYTPGANGATSPEVSRFLASRPQARPGTLQFMVVLHDGSA